MCSHVAHWCNNILKHCDSNQDDESKSARMKTISMIGNFFLIKLRSNEL